VVIVDKAVYTHGVRRPGTLELTDALEAASDPDSFVWIGLFEPSEDEFAAVREQLDLHELAVEDAITAHQRPKLEVYEGDLFVVLKTARYDDDLETIEFAELQIFTGPSYIVSVRHGEASALSEVRAGIERDLAKMRCGPMAVLHAIIDRVVDDYAPVIDGLDNDMAEIEDTVFTPNRPRGYDPSERIFRLKREVLDLYRNTEPLLEPLGRLVSGNLPQHHPELGSYFRDVEDHLKREVGALAHLRDLLSDALDANLAQITVRQNDDMRTISAWLAIGGFPTVVGAIYGMNFRHMPELHTRYGYYVVLVVMALLCFWLYRRFKRIGWL
jgi:magnesium transporter